MQKKLIFNLDNLRMNSEEMYQKMCALLSNKGIVRAEHERASFQIIKANDSGIFFERIDIQDKKPQDITKEQMIKVLDHVKDSRNMTIQSIKDIVSNDLPVITFLYAGDIVYWLIN